MELLPTLAGSASVRHGAVANAIAMGMIYSRTDLPTVEHLMDAHDMSRATAYRWRKAMEAARYLADRIHLTQPHAKETMTTAAPVHLQFPLAIGSMARTNALDLARDAVSRMAAYRNRHWKAAVLLQPCGTVVMDSPDQATHRDFVVTINRQSKAFQVAEDLREAWAHITD